MRQVRVVRVLDGDTVHVRDISASDDTPVEKVRLQGIDAPETKQKYGPEATAALNRLLFPGQNVYLEAQEKPDKYGRTLGRLWTIYYDLGQVPSNRVDVNLAMVKGGHAWVYRKYPFPDGYDEAEKYAKEHASSPGGSSNLWADPNPEPPWDWRQRHKPACRGCGKRKARYRVRHRNIGEAIPVCSQVCAALGCAKDGSLWLARTGGIAGVHDEIRVYPDGRIYVSHSLTEKGTLVKTDPELACRIMDQARELPEVKAPSGSRDHFNHHIYWLDTDDQVQRHITVERFPKEVEDFLIE